MKEKTKLESLYPTYAHNRDNENNWWKSERKNRQENIGF